ncbi:Protein YiiM [Pseudomonas fluorescens]|uniref:Protein YiiM n=1 Tax=Pseudomonas fluorescens TaxID=294 RepID=A0A5E6UGE9_PSEFL|nr:MOSC domain-containing protein [Pseudomonas fluorescens]VVN02314.1 Protein YiiM [Pseudomonas fluorescens]
MTLTAVIDQLFAGGIGILKPEGQSSGMFKHRLSGPVRVEFHGLAGDQHADLRVHGGPEKAVHQYPAQNYAHIAQAFAHCAAELVPGSLGENLSASCMSERTVHIGDIYRMGTCIVQVSQPRSPCWKINHRFAAERMSMFVATQRITGWYYRVLQPGSIEAGDSIELLERPSPQFSIDRFWAVQLCHRPLIDDLLTLSVTPGLAEDWRRRLSERAKWILKQDS